MAESGKKWYALRAMSGKEAKAKEYLELAIKNGDFGTYVGQVLIPMERVTTVKAGGKKVTKERNMMPGYIFVEAELKGDVSHRLTNSPNILGFMLDDPKNPMAKPTPLRPVEVKRLLGSVDGQLTEETAEIDSVQYTVGEAVKVIYGPCTGFSATVEEVSNDHKKLKVMVKIFGRKTPVELSFAQVEKE